MSRYHDYPGICSRGIISVAIVPWGREISSLSGCFLSLPEIQWIICFELFNNFPGWNNWWRHQFSLVGWLKIAPGAVIEKESDYIFSKNGRSVEAHMNGSSHPPHENSWYCENTLPHWFFGVTLRWRQLSSPPGVRSLNPHQECDFPG